MPAPSAISSSSDLDRLCSVLWQTCPRRKPPLTPPKTRAACGHAISVQPKTISSRTNASGLCQLVRLSMRVRAKGPTVSICLRIAHVLWVGRKAQCQRRANGAGLGCGKMFTDTFIQVRGELNNRSAPSAHGALSAVAGLPAEHAFQPDKGHAPELALPLPALCAAWRRCLRKTGCRS